MSSNKQGNKRVVVFFGRVACGKSTLAQLWAARHGYPYGNTDVVRKQLAVAASARGETLYSTGHSRRTYEALADFAVRAMQEADTVVLDGSYQLRAERERLQGRCAGLAKVVFVLCSCGEEAVKNRLAIRARDPQAVSDGNWQVYCLQEKLFEAPEELSSEQLLRVETEKEAEALATTLDALLARLEGGDGFAA